MRQAKLIPGKMNIPYIRVKSGVALGAKRPTKLKNRPEVAKVLQFNTPTLIIKLIKAAWKKY